MEKHQIISVIEKLHSEIKSELDSILYRAADATCKLDLSGNEMNHGNFTKVKFCYDNSQGTTANNIAIDKNDNTINIVIATSLDRVEGFYRIKFRFFDIVWWKWRSFNNMLKNHMKKVKSIKKQVEKNNYDLRFNNAYVTMFPDEINNILLGGKDE